MRYNTFVSIARIVDSTFVYLFSIFYFLFSIFYFLFLFCLRFFQYTSQLAGFPGSLFPFNVPVLQSSRTPIEGPRQSIIIYVGLPQSTFSYLLSQSWNTFLGACKSPMNEISAAFTQLLIAIKQPSPLQ